MRIARCFSVAMGSAFIVWILAIANPVESRPAAAVSIAISPKAKEFQSPDRQGSTTRRIESKLAFPPYISEWQLAKSNRLNLRGTRRLNGAYQSFEDLDVKSAEAGFALAVVLVIVLALMLCCCCCRGNGCSLWDVVACLCIWELCCDRDGGAFNDFARL